MRPHIIPVTHVSSAHEALALARATALRKRQQAYGPAAVEPATPRRINTDGLPMIVTRPAPAPASEPAPAAISETIAPITIAIAEAGQRETVPVNDVDSTALVTRPTLAFISGTVARLYDVSVVDLKSCRKPARIARVRQIAMWICQQLTFRSSTEIGSHFGGRDHTTALHAFAMVKRLRLSDPAMMTETDTALRLVRASWRQREQGADAVFSQAGSCVTRSEPECCA